jgi:hypothetical protein
MSQDLIWIDRIGSLDAGVKLINEIGWTLKFGETNGRWYIQSGEKVIFSADTPRAVEAVLYGMALAYSVLPSSYIESLRDEFGVEEDE